MGFYLGFTELSLNFSSIAFIVTSKNILQAHRSQGLNFQKIQKLQKRGRLFIYQMMFKLPGNWGTKWDITAKQVEIEYEDSEQLEVSFDTAWAPPEEICYRLREMFKDLHFSWFYDEPGMEVAGYL